MPTHRIIVIDDDLDIREAVSDSLVDEGYDVDAFGSGTVALAHLRERFDASVVVILLDWMMPGMNGGEVFEELRKDTKLSQIPVVLLTADTQAREKAEALGIPRYLRKPLRLEDLFRTVAQFADRAGAP